LPRYEIVQRQLPEKTLNPPGIATPMRPRPFLLLFAGFALRRRR
jgi:hypothetical protein